jgi:hypothetical protein
LNVAITLLRILLGLFADDLGFALSVLATVLIVGVLAWLLPGAPELTGGLLLVGCVAVLIGATLRARR